MTYWFLLIWKLWLWKLAHFFDLIFLNKFNYPSTWFESEKKTKKFNSLWCLTTLKTLRPLLTYYLGSTPTCFKITRSPFIKKLKNYMLKWKKNHHNFLLFEHDFHELKKTLVRIDCLWIEKKGGHWDVFSVTLVWSR